MAATVHPVDDQIFVKRQVKGTDDNADASCLRGAIAAFGPGMPTMDGGRMQLTVLNAGENGLVGLERGDGVIYNPDSAQEITIESGTFDVLHFRDVICVLKNDAQ